jgi:hypothetical protein
MISDEKDAITAQVSKPLTLDAAWLKKLALDHGADDAGLVSIEDPIRNPSR